MSAYQYRTAAYRLQQFDQFCIENKVMSPCITKELSDKWGLLRDGEAPATQSGRISVVRQLSLYMQASGIESYVPRNFAHKAKPVAYILDGTAEVRALFAQVNAYRPEQSCEAFHRLALEYRVLFRIIFCCGLRVSEARKLRVTDVDLKQGIEETLTYCDFPSEHSTNIRTNNVIERMNREIRRRTRVVGAFPDENSALMLVCARLRHVAGTQWGSKKYMNIQHRKTWSRSRWLDR